MGIPSHLPYPCFPSSRFARLERAVTAFIQADFQLPVMLRLEFSANSLLRSEVHSQPQSWLVKSWQFGCCGFNMFRTAVACSDILWVRE